MFTRSYGVLCAALFVNTGQIRVKYKPNTGPISAKYRPNTCQSHQILALIPTGRPSAVQYSAYSPWPPCRAPGEDEADLVRPDRMSSTRASWWRSSSGRLECICSTVECSVVQCGVLWRPVQNAFLIHKQPPSRWSWRKRPRQTRGPPGEDLRQPVRH